MTLREQVAQAGLGCLLTSPEAPLTLSATAIPSFVLNNGGGFMPDSQPRSMRSIQAWVKSELQSFHF